MTKNNNFMVLFVFLFFNQYICPSADSFFTIAQENARNKSSFRVFKIGKIQTPEQYLEDSFQASEFFGIITRNVKITRLIMNAQGDGNCGYRAFLGSIFLNAIVSGNKAVVIEMQRLVQTNFVNLFMRYNNDFSADLNHLKIIKVIQKYIHYMIDQINKMSTIEEVRNLLNKEFAFDYYMIMFFRYLIVDYIENSLLRNENVVRMLRFIVAPEETNPQRRDLQLREEDRVSKLLTTAQAIFIGALQADKIDSDKYIQQILTWKDQLTLDQSKLLGLLLGVSVYTLSQENEYQPLAISLSDREAGMATLLYIPGHYRIFIPISYDKNVLSTFFEVKKVVKRYDSLVSEVRDFWQNQDMIDIIYNIIKNQSSRITVETADFINHAAELGNALQTQGQLQLFATEYMLLNQALRSVQKELDSEDSKKIIDLKQKISDLVRLLEVSIPSLPAIDQSLQSSQASTTSVAVVVPSAVDKKASVKILLDAIAQDEKNDENLLMIAHTFWQEYYDSINHLLSMNAQILGPEMLVYIENALSLGSKLLKIGRLQDYQMQYQTLAAVLAKIESIVDQQDDTKIKLLKKRSNKLIKSLNLHEVKIPNNPITGSFAEEPYDEFGNLIEY